MTRVWQCLCAECATQRDVCAVYDASHGPFAHLRTLNHAMCALLPPEFYPHMPECQGRNPADIMQTPELQALTRFKVWSSQ